MLTIILIVLGYIVIGGIIGGVIGVITDDTDLALPYGVLWPVSVPLLIISFIIRAIIAIVSIFIEAAGSHKERE